MIQKEYHKICRLCKVKFTSEKIQDKFCSLKCRFLFNVDKTKNGCWQWTSYKDWKGYGHFYLNGKHVKAHRFSYKFFKKEEIPKGKIVCHTCDNPSCVNPGHLWIGTHKDNADDKMKKGRFTYMRGEKSKRSTLTNKQALEVFRMSGTHQDIADKFKVGKHVISDIKRKKTYKEIHYEIVPSER